MSAANNKFHESRRYGVPGRNWAEVQNPKEPIPTSPPPSAGGETIDVTGEQIPQGGDHPGNGPEGPPVGESGGNTSTGGGGGDGGKGGKNGKGGGLPLQQIWGGIKSAGGWIGNNAGALLPLAGGVLGMFAGHGDTQAATNAVRDARDQYNSLDPRIQAHYAQAEGQGMGDPSNKTAQLDALNRLRGVYNSNGLDATSRAQINQAQTSNAAQAQALNSQMDQQMEQRGTADSGAAYAHARANGVNAANANNQAALQALAQGQQNRNAALQGAGQLAGQIRQSDDAINRFNAYNRTQNNQFNAGQGQNAQQQSFSNSLDRVGGIASADNNLARVYTNNGQAIADQWRGAGQAAGALYNNYNRPSAGPTQGQPAAGSPNADAAGAPASGDISI